ncbi:unnamed protein product [Cunninghamella blakesleeana]
MKDFNIPLDASFRQMGWKKLYKHLSDSRVYTWGENSDYRLGLDPESSRGVRRFFNSYSVATPQEITSLRGKNIVDIAAGGWSFHALDRHGGVWMWGTLEPANYHRRGRRGESELVRQPTKVNLPEGVHIASISCGRSHAIALDRNGDVWHWNNIYRPQKVRLQPSTPPTEEDNHKIIQVSANWGQSSILTDHGELIVVPLPGNFPPPTDDNLIPDDLVLDKDTLSKISLSSLGQDDRINRSSTKTTSKLARPVLENDTIVQIAGMENETLFLSKFGRIYKANTALHAQLTLSPSLHTVEYIHFGAKENQNEINERNKLNRFISATFRNFAVYTLDGEVLTGKQDDSFDEYPKKISNQGICKVSFGDYHFGALTNNGKLLTWGAFSAGAVGHGEVPENEKDVVLDYPKEVEALSHMYAFSIGFGGWHSGVLAVPRN